MPALRAAPLAWLLVLCASPAAWADGKRDLEDGIAFYENLDTERAIERLTAATKAKDLGDADRARAFLYLGIVKFEVGKEAEAEPAWRSAFSLAPTLAAPAGTSPKIVQAMEKVRATSTKRPDPPKVEPKVEPKPPPPVTPEITKEPGEPKNRPEAVENPALTTPPVPPEEDDGDGPGWLLWAGVGAGAVGAAVLTIVLLGSGGSDCKGAGGCAVVTLR
jgi:hypothetical protein